MNYFFYSITLLLYSVSTTLACNVDPRSGLRTLEAGSLTTPPPPPAAASGCGHSQYFHYSPISSIVGGQNIYRNQYPWMVRLKIRNGDGEPSLCSATILNHFWLLTAAHCFGRDVIPQDILPIFGDYDKAIVDSGEVTRTVKELIHHPYHDLITQNNDFALLKLDKALKFDNWNIQPICLPQSCSDGCQAGSLAYIAGWGLLAENGKETPDIMQTGLVKVRDISECQIMYSKVKTATITDRMLCANVEHGGIDTCAGDSGGPLMVMEDGYYKICGVTSFGQGCGRRNFPGIYSRVCSVLDWIHRYIHS